MLYRRLYSAMASFNDFDCRFTVASNAFWAFLVSCKTGWGQSASSGVARIGGPKNRIIVVIEIAESTIMHILFLWQK